MTPNGLRRWPMALPDAHWRSRRQTRRPSRRQLIPRSEGLPRLDRGAIAQITAAASRKGGEQIKPITLDFLIANAQNRARAMALESDGADKAGAWVDAADQLTRLARESETLYLDAKQTLYAASA
jgi:DNA polymerase-3 subunit delta'